MANDEKQIWFPAKKYGYGWGLPVTWQGWTVLLSYVLLITLGAVTLTDSAAEVAFLVAYSFVLSLLMVFICYKKGEKLEWRWGKKKR